jgi:SAM-dependent methyltransferase
MAERRDSKDAEKDYLRRTGGSAWEREKPFSPAGTDNFEEGLELLNDFVVALWLLQPSATDRILDIGAGGGWCSDLLHRLSRRSIAVDISVDMLRIARQRGARGPIPAIAGDLEHLPFCDGSFDKAICLSALHHVPDMGAAVREIHRVLTDRGVVVFSEPGTGHADKPWSVAATRDFGVLEQEVLIEPTIQLCRDAGFRHVHVCPISYVIPEFELTDDEWRSWMRLPKTKRPLRALEKMWRAFLELLGAGKKDMLFEEAFAMRLVRLLQVPVQEHPFIVATKGDERRRRRATYRAAVDVVHLDQSISAGGIVHATVTATNQGSAAWRATGTNGAGQVQLGIQLLDAESRVIDKDFARCPLPRDVAPGESVQFAAAFGAPPTAGVYALKFDLVCEGVTWFEPVGSPIVTRPLHVN